MVHRAETRLTYDEVMVKLLSKRMTKKGIIFLTLYATGCRVGELIQIRPQDIREEEINGKPCIVFRLFTEKNKQQTERIVPINKKTEDWLAIPIINYANMRKSLGAKLMFPYHRCTIYKWCMKHVGFNPHEFRHLRATHKASEYTDQQMAKFFGWSDSRPANIYSHLRYKDLI